MVIGWVGGGIKNQKKRQDLEDVDNTWMGWLKLWLWKQARREKGTQKSPWNHRDEGSGITAGSAGTPTKLRTVGKIEKREKIYPYEKPSFKKFSMTLGRRNTHALKSFYHDC